MGLLNNYNDYIKMNQNEYTKEIYDANENNLFTKIFESDNSNYFRRYYYNKTGLDISNTNRILIAPKDGYIVQRLSYISDDLIGGVRNGTQAINIDDSVEGKITLRSKGSVGQVSLKHLFHSLAYALGIKIDVSKVDIFPILNDALHDFNFLFYAPLNTVRFITPENIDNIDVVFIAYNNRTYFDKALLQALTNSMFRAGWFDVEYLVSMNNYNEGDILYYTRNDNLYAIVEEASKRYDAFLNRYIDRFPESSYKRSYNYFSKIYNHIKSQGFNKDLYKYIKISISSGLNSVSISLECFNPDIFNKFEVYRKEMKNGDTYYWLREITTGDYKYEYRGKSTIVTCFYFMDNDTYNFNMHDETSDYIQYDCGIFNNSKTSDNTSGTGVSLSAFNIMNEVKVLRGKEGITYIDGGVLPNGEDLLETDYPEWNNLKEDWKGTAIDWLNNKLINIFKIVSFLPLNLITNGTSYPKKENGEPYTPMEVTTYEVLLPEIIPPQKKFVIDTLTAIPTQDDDIADPNDPVTYEPLIDPQNPQNYPPKLDDNIDYPPDYKNDDNSNPTEPPSRNEGDISIPPINPTDSVTSCKLFSVYNPTPSEIDSLGGYLWGESIAGTLASIFTNPINAIISLHCIYCTPDIGAKKNIYLGYLNSGIPSNVVTKQYKEVDCGTIRIPEYYGDCRDYSPYTTISLFLPFIGFRPIKVDDVMGSELNIKYFVDVYTGTCLACVSVNKGGVIQLTYNFDGNCSVMLPLTSGSWANMTVGLATALTSMIVNPVAGALQIPNALHNGISMSSQGQIGCNAGAMGRKKPYVVITNTQAYDAIGYNELYGYPANILTRLGQLTGYTRVKEVHVENVNNATVDEKNEIERLLKSGVIIS